MEAMKEHASSIGVDDLIDFLGFRKDIGQLIAISDVGISASRQEGLGLNLAEEMFTGLPVVATNDRGHRELVVDNHNGFLFPQQNSEKFIEYVNKLYEDSALRLNMGANAKQYVQKFSIDNALNSLASIYQKYM